jgi:two-component system, chemotaxis family, chemotaxis protein CheY
MSRTVLVVEDDQDGRELLGELLSLHGFRAVLAVDGVAALEALKTERPCMILLDLMMPRMNGWQFREAQLADPLLQSIPVIVVSADGNIARKASEVRAAAYVRKPVDASELIRAVHKYCLPSDGPSNP